MAITASCDKCHATFSLRNEFAGKKIKCPKCTNAFVVPAAAGTAGQAVANRAPNKMATANSGRGYNPLMDLLDEAGVQAKARGRGCDHCGAEVKPGAIICIECGYNLETGQQLSTSILIDESDRGMADDMTDAEKRMAKAEREIDEMPVSSFGQDFGEGKESFLIALVAIIALLVFTGIGVACVLLMDKITEYVQPALISFIAACCIYVACAIWLTILGFLVNTGHGAASLFTAGLYGIIFGFMKGGGALLPTIIMIAAILIGAVSALFAFSPPTPDYSWLPNVGQWLAMAVR